MSDANWIFGYGSLVWRPAFAHLERRPAAIRGYARRFWQASTDHRGTPAAPGRVATLVEERGGVCWGMAYRVSDRTLSETLAALDYREKDGYRRLQTPIYFERRGEPAAEALVYVAGPGNPNYLGPSPLSDIAAVVRQARGPSGSNVEYVLELEEALEAIGGLDEHVAELASLVKERERAS